ncbi:hypothetical protein ACK3RO_004801 [Enterobacter kobei]
MRAIRTVTASMISTILADDFNVGMLKENPKRAREFVQIDVEDLDALVERIGEVRDAVVVEKEERHKEATEALQALQENEAVRALLGDFNSLEELLEAAGGVAKAHRESTTRTSTPSSTSNNKTFAIELYDTVSGKTIHGKAVNKKLTADIENSEAYKTLIEKDPSMADFDTFMRKYSEEYRNEYPLNAKYNGKEFHINARGKLNQYAMVHFEDFKKKDKSGADDKALLAKFKEKVLNS